MGKAVKLAVSDQIINKAGSPGASLSGIAPVYTNNFTLID
jgi:hypothetical protein